MKNFSFLVFFLLLTIIFSSSSVLLYSQGISYGDSASLGNGTIKGWIKTKASNNPQSIGLTLTEDALTNLPSIGTETHLNLPKNASDTLFNHLLFDWNPGGHPPPGIYNLPHFDLHFYMISKAEREAILGGPDPTIVEPRFVPPDYVKDPGGVPKMGTHWTDRTAPEFNGQVFTKTFIYGSDKGKFIFVEPMFTKAYLETHPHFTGNIKQPAEFQKEGYYPTSFKIDYDSVAHIFNIEITDFVLRQASPVKVEVDVRSLDNFTLEQNYPNPFNPSTVINYSLPTASNVKLEVFNVTGEKVATLVDGFKNEGYYEVSFDASSAAGGLPSGLYLYRISAGTFVTTKKMLLMK